MRKATIYAPLFIVVALLLISPTLAADDPAGCETGYDYGATKGPGQWGSLRNEWRLCDAGRYQSPIVLVAGPADQSLPQITRSYQNTNYEIKNNGLTVKLRPKRSPGTLTHDGVIATLTEFHFHVPAEHVMNQRLAPAEIHFVHQLPDGRLVVTAVLVSVGAENTGLKEIIGQIPKLCDTGTIHLSLESLMPTTEQQNHYFTYFGSLTTPPCTEGVTWIVYGQGITATQQQINALKIAATGNARPIPDFTRWRP